MTCLESGRLSLLDTTVQVIYLCYSAALFLTAIFAVSRSERSSSHTDFSCVFFSRLPDLCHLCFYSFQEMIFFPTSPTRLSILTPVASSRISLSNLVLSTLAGTWIYLTSAVPAAINSHLFMRRETALFALFPVLRIMYRVQTLQKQMRERKACNVSHLNHLYSLKCSF